MNPNKQWSLLVIDLTGSALVVMCFLGILWFTTIRASQHSYEISKLTNIHNSINQQLAHTQNQCEQMRLQLSSIESDTNITGNLPESPPVENYFQTLSLLANKHELRVLRHHPLTERNYSDLNEQRFLYEVSGTLPHLVQFFEAVESTDYWADISYLKIDQGRGMYRSVSKQRVAMLTISMFSSTNSSKDNTDS